MGFDVRRIFEGWKVLMRSHVALATVMDVQNGYAGNTSRHVSIRSHILTRSCAPSALPCPLVNAGEGEIVSKEVGEEERGALLYACGKVTVWIA